MKKYKSLIFAFCAWLSVFGLMALAVAFAETGECNFLILGSTIISTIGMIKTIPDTL